MEVLLRNVIAFSFLLFFTRILGKKQMNQLTYFNYVTGITLGSIAADISIDNRIPILNGVMSLAIWSILTFLVSFISLKSYKARVFFDGQPDIIIKKGKILGHKLKKSHLNIDDVTMLLREKDIFSITDVEYAVLEPHGKLSILKKPNLDNVTKKDLSINEAPIQYLPTDIIIDGKIMRRNLMEIGLDNKWLEGALIKNNLSLIDVKNIFYMAIQKDGEIYIDFKKDNL